MKKTFNSPEEFYKVAMEDIQATLGQKLRILGVVAEDIKDLVDEGHLLRYTSDEVDGIILEMYEYKGIRLMEVEWTSNSVKQRDINPDERSFERNI